MFDLVRNKVLNRADLKSVRASNKDYETNCFFSNLFADELLYKEQFKIV